MLIIVLGPTASGKTDFAIKLAEKRDSEIICADSVSIYRELIVGSAAPTDEEKSRVSHHLTGILDLSEDTNANQFMDLAKKTYTEILSRGKDAVMVGGTNFYVASFLKGFSPIPDIDESFKKEIRERFENFSTEELFESLQKIDSKWADSISSSNDRQRIIRGLEIFEVTGKPISYFNELPRINGFSGSYIKIALDWDRAVLYERVNKRTEIMLRGGLIEETENIMKKGYSPENCKALRSIGYLETFQYLRGEIKGKKELYDLIAQHTRNLAKRQLTWLRPDPEIRWIKPETTPEQLLKIIEEQSR